MPISTSSVDDEALRTFHIVQNIYFICTTATAVLLLLLISCCERLMKSCYDTAGNWYSSCSLLLDCRIGVRLWVRFFFFFQVFLAAAVARPAVARTLCSPALPFARVTLPLPQPDPAHWHGQPRSYGLRSPGSSFAVEWAFVPDLWFACFLSYGIRVCSTSDTGVWRSKFVSRLLLSQERA